MKKVLICLLVLVLSVSFLLVACDREVVYVYVDGNVDGNYNQTGNQGQSGSQGSTIVDDGSTYNLKVWCAEEDYDMILDMLDEYKELHSKNYYNFTLETVGEDVVSTSVTRDIEASADVFSFANDQLGLLLNQNALYKIPNTYKSQIESQINVAVTSCKSDGDYYAIPYSYENCFLYYNKSLVSESDVKSLEGLLSKSIQGVSGNLGIDMSDSYYTTMFLYTAGVEIFGPQGNDPTSVSLANDNAIKACKYIASLGSQSKLLSIVKTDQYTALNTNQVAAMISGPHMISEFKKALGDNFGVAMLPTIKLDGKDTQLISFSGVKMYGISNKSTSVRDSKTTAEACRLAAFLANDDNQQTRLEEREFCPTSEELFDVAVESGIPTVEVVVNQSNYSNLKPGISQMSAYWTPMANFLQGVYTLNKGESTWLSELKSIENTIKDK